MPKVKVIEVTGIKLDPHADYLIAVNIQSFIGSEIEKLYQLEALDKMLNERIGDKALIVPVMGKVSDNIKVFQIQKEITISKEIKDGKQDRPLRSEIA